MKKKTAGVMMAGIMSLTLLTACGSAGSSDGGNGDNVAQDMIDQYSQYVTLCDYKGVEYIPQVTEVTEEDMQYYRDLFISNYTTSEEVTEGTVEMGDSVNIDYVGYIDGTEFQGGSTEGAGTVITLGEARYIDDFEEQIAGHEVGEHFEIEVTFPEDYGNEDLNGRDAVFHITINSLINETAPEYNDELVAENTDYSTVEEYEDYIMSSLEEAYAEADESANQDSVMNYILENSTFGEYPEEEITELIDATMAEIQESAEANEVELDVYISYVYGYASEDDFRDYVRETINNYTNRKIVITAIAKAESIIVTEEDVSAMQQKLLDAYGYTELSELEDYYSEEDYIYYALSDKVTDLLMENAVSVDEDGNIIEATVSTSTDAE